MCKQDCWFFSPGLLTYQDDLTGYSPNPTNASTKIHQSIISQLRSMGSTRQKSFKAWCAHLYSCGTKNNVFLLNRASENLLDRNLKKKDYSGRDGWLKRSKYRICTPDDPSLILRIYVRSWICICNFRTSTGRWETETGKCLEAHRCSAAEETMRPQLKVETRTNS